MKFIGNLQVYSRPFASLYYDDEERCPFVLVRISSLKEHIMKYAAKKITFSWLEKYLKRRAALRTLFRKGSDFVVEIDNDKIWLSEDNKNALNDVFKNQERFDPDFCYDKPQIQCFINSQIRQ